MGEHARIFEHESAAERNLELALQYQFRTRHTQRPRPCLRRGGIGVVEALLTQPGIEPGRLSLPYTVSAKDRLLLRPLGRPTLHWAPSPDTARPFPPCASQASSVHGSAVIRLRCLVCPGHPPGQRVPCHVADSAETSVAVDSDISANPFADSITVNISAGSTYRPSSIRTFSVSAVTPAASVISPCACSVIYAPGSPVWYAHGPR